MAQRVKTDWILFFAVVFLMAFGLLMLYSASAVVAERRYGSSYYFLCRQLGWALAAVFCMMRLKRIDYRRLNTPQLAYAAIGAGALAAGLAAAGGWYTRRRWLRR